MKIVMTGAFEVGPNHVTRKTLTQILTQMGYTVGNTVTRDTDVLVAGNTGRHGETRKLRAAQSHGVRVIDPKTLLQEIAS